MKASSRLLRLAVATSLTFSLTAKADQFYGPVKGNDTLSKIIKKHYIGSGSQSHQLKLMNRIANDNPAAFAGGDINLLLKDSVLKLPGADWNISGYQLPDLSDQTPVATTGPATITTAAGVTIAVPKPQPAPVASAAPVVGARVALDATAVVSSGAVAPVSNQELRQQIAVLEAERADLYKEVSRLSAEAQRLNEKIESLTQLNRRSDEQLRILDSEIISLTKSLIEQSYIPNLDEASAEVGALQQRLQLAEAENNQLTRELLLAKSELSHTQTLKEKADSRIIEVASQNQELRQQLDSKQPGANFYAEPGKSQTLSLGGGLVSMPLWMAILGGALLSLILIALLATRRRRYEPEELETQVAEEPVAINNDNVFTLDSLLQSGSDDTGFDTDDAATSYGGEEGNVFQMFDGGSLTMDLKLDMAKAYIDVDDPENAQPLLDEVINNGSEVQRRKATRLMAEAA